MSSKKLMSRRDLLKAMGIGGAALASGSLLPGVMAKPLRQDIDMMQEVTLKLMLPQAERPALMDEIIAEAEQRMLAAGMNTRLDITFVPWGADLSKLTVALAAGEEVDLVFDAPWLAINQNIAQDFYIQLDDDSGTHGNLLETYGPNILAARPDLMWEANRFAGRVMGIPLGAYHYQGRSWLIRKDIREEIGYPEIQTWEELEGFLYAVKEARPDIMPIKAAPVGHALFHDFDTSLRSIDAPDFDVIYLSGNDGVVRNVFDDLPGLFWDYVVQGRQWLEDGLIPPEIPASGDPYAIDGGRTAVAQVNDFGYNAAVRRNVEALGGDLEWVTFFDQSKKRVVNFLQYNFICLGHASPNPERAIAFLNWANEKENYDLLAYGFEGRNYEAIGDDQYRPNPDDLYPWFPFAWIWNPTHNRENANAAPGAVEWNRWSADADNFEGDILLGFTKNTEPVLNEVSQMNALKDQYWRPLTGGVVTDIDGWWSQFEAQAAPLARSIQAEYQRQIDEFLNNA